MKIKSNWDKKEFDINEGDSVEMSIYMNYKKCKVTRLFEYNNGIWFEDEDGETFNSAEILNKL